MDRKDELPGTPLRRYLSQRSTGMTQQEPDQLAPGVSRTSNDGNIEHCELLTSWQLAVGSCQQEVIRSDNWQLPTGN
jgi:hypothetical protein